MFFVFFIVKKTFLEFFRIVSEKFDFYFLVWYNKNFAQSGNLVKNGRFITFFLKIVKKSVFVSICVWRQENFVV